MKRWRLLSVCSLALLTSAIVAFPAPIPETTADAKTPALSTFDKEQRDTLLRYAKAVFLAGLALGAPVPPPEGLPELQRPCFVTFFAGKRVIACFGSFHPRTASLSREIAANVEGAIRNDRRVRHADRDSALNAGVQITFPGELVPITDYRRIDPSREGLFVERDREGVAIVPGEAKTASWAYREALRRLGEKDPAAVRLYKFRATFWTTRS